MDSATTSAIISASAVVVAGLALASNGFWIGRTLDQFRLSMEERFNTVSECFNAVAGRFDAIDQRFNEVDRRLSVIEADLKDVVKITNDLDRRLDRLEQKK
jgi:septation ring formation regulator EzrA